MLPIFRSRLTIFHAEKTQNGELGKQRQSASVNSTLTLTDTCINHQHTDIISKITAILLTHPPFTRSIYFGKPCKPQSISQHPAGQWRAVYIRNISRYQLPISPSDHFTHIYTTRRRLQRPIACSFNAV